jgi:hypothetical protein
VARTRRATEGSGRVSSGGWRRHRADQASLPAGTGANRPRPDSRESGHENRPHGSNTGRRTWQPGGMPGPQTSVAEKALHAQVGRFSANDEHFDEVGARPRPTDSPRGELSQARLYPRCPPDDTAYVARGEGCDGREGTEPRRGLPLRRSSNKSRPARRAVARRRSRASAHPSSTLSARLGDRPFSFLRKAARSPLDTVALALTGQVRAHDRAREVAVGSDSPQWRPPAREAVSDG